MTSQRRGSHHDNGRQDGAGRGAHAAGFVEQDGSAVALPFGAQAARITVSHRNSHGLCSYASGRRATHLHEGGCIGLYYTRDTDPTETMSRKCHMSGSLTGFGWMSASRPWTNPLRGRACGG